MGNSALQLCNTEVWKHHCANTMSRALVSTPGHGAALQRLAWRLASVTPRSQTFPMLMLMLAGPPRQHSGLALRRGTSILMGSLHDWDGKERTRHLSVSSALGVVWIPALLAVMSSAVQIKAKIVCMCAQRGVESNKTLLASAFAWQQARGAWAWGCLSAALRSSA